MDAIGSLIISMQESSEPPTDIHLCYICRRFLGSTVLCRGCYQVSAHRRCADIKGQDWKCPNCSTHLDLKEVKHESEPTQLAWPSERKSGYLLTALSSIKYELNSEDFESGTVKREETLPVKGVFTLPAELLSAETVYKRILLAAASDDSLLTLLATKQCEYESEVQDFESRKTGLQSTNLGASEYRLALFRMQERHLSEVAHIKADLLAQLQSAHVYGFQSVRLLKGSSALTDPPSAELDSYHLTQKAVIDKLLSHLQPTKVKPSYIIPKRHRQKLRVPDSLGSVLLNPLAVGSVFNTLARVATRLKSQPSQSSFSVPLLSALVKGVFDAAEGRARSCPGCFTDPDRIDALLQQVRNQFL